MNRHYANTENTAPSPVLQVVKGGEAYRPNVLHAEIDNRSEGTISPRHHEHSHSFLHILLYTEGEGRFSLEGKKTPFRRGSLVLMGPGLSHSFGSCSGKPYAYSEVTFTMPLVGATKEDEENELGVDMGEVLRLFSGIEGLSVPVVTQLAEDQTREVEDVFGKLLDYLLARGQLSPFYAGLTMTELFSLAVKACSHGAVPAPEPLERARLLIERQYASPLTVDELAAQAHLSRGYFLRAFKAAYGQPPIAYQHEIRIRAARILLKTTDLPCKAIAAKVGYSDPYHFSRTFRRLTGFTPTQIRKQ